MSAPTGVDTDLVTRICRDATTGSRNGTRTEDAEDVDVVGDPLDGTAWVGMASWSHARDALTALNAHGISGHDCQDGRLHVTGWDIRLLHWRLGALLAGVDDLTNVETAIRRCVPFPRQTPRIHDVDSMLELITAAEDAYQQLIAEHVDYAEHVLAQHTRPTARCGTNATRHGS